MVCKYLEISPIHTKLRRSSLSCILTPFKWKPDHINSKQEPPDLQNLENDDVFKDWGSLHLYYYPRGLKFSTKVKIIILIKVHMEFGHQTPVRILHSPWNLQNLENYDIWKDQRWPKKTRPKKTKKTHLKKPIKKRVFLVFFKNWCRNVLFSVFTVFKMSLLSLTMPTVPRCHIINWI